ncbi:MAG: ATP-binding protein [Nitrospiraceae bacterium]|nr:ATP-binding protein [Nitrospiraceae bacterium]
MKSNHPFLPRQHRSLDLFQNVCAEELATAGEGLRAEAHQRKQAEEQIRTLTSQLAVELQERRKAEKALQLREIHLASLDAAASGFPYSAKILNGRLDSVCYGPGCLAVTGYYADAFDRNPSLWFTMIIREDRRPLSRAFRNILSGAPHAVVEHRILRSDGTIRWVRNAIRACRSEAGKLTGCEGFIADITDLKELEIQLFEARQREIAGMLASSIMHDFGNILAAMIGHASLLQIKIPADDPRIQHIRSVISLAERAVQLSRKILAGSGRQSFSPRLIDLRAVVANLLPLIGPLLGENIKVTVRQSAEELLVAADQLQLEQMLLNLIVNARDAMPCGGSLTLATRSVPSLPKTESPEGSRPTPSAHIEVADTGKGIPSQALRRIYDPFFTTKEPDRGTGLGLAIVKTIVEQHGGQIACASFPDKGTVFDIAIPLAARIRETRFGPDQ